VTDMFKALLGNFLVNIFQHTRHATIEEAVFSIWSASRNNTGAVFSVCGRCRENIRVYGNRHSVQTDRGLVYIVYKF
jgi:hypothetical protein